MSALATLAPPKAQIRRMSTVLLVDAIEPCLDFWINRLGFELTLRVAGPEGLDFAVLARDGLELNYRTRRSLHRGNPGLLDGDRHEPWAVHYLVVDDLDELLPRLEGVEIVAPLRDSDFGGRELYVREPSGRVIALICPGPADD